MANLIGYLQGSRGQASRLGHTDIQSRLETWQGSIVTTLEKDGTFTVRIGQKGSYGEVVATGNVNDGERMVRVPSLRTCAYPDDIHGEHDHAMCEDASTT